MDFDKRAAAWLMARLMSRDSLQPAGRIEPDSAIFTVKFVTAVSPYVLGEHAHLAKDMAEVVHQSMVVDSVLSPLEGAFSGPEAEQAKIDEQAKAEQVKADAELAAAVIEEQTGILQKEISDEAGKSAGEIDALKRDFEREQRDLEGKLDEMARNYFDKYPDLSDDRRRDATDTFKGVKDEATGNLRGQQETRLEELTRAQQQQQEQREDLEERRKELEGTRDERS